MKEKKRMKLLEDEGLEAGKGIVLAGVGTELRSEKTRPPGRGDEGG